MADGGARTVNASYGPTFVSVRSNDNYGGGLCVVYGVKQCVGVGSINCTGVAGDAKSGGGDSAKAAVAGGGGGGGVAVLLTESTPPSVGFSVSGGAGADRTVQVSGFSGRARSGSGGRGSVIKGMILSGTFFENKD